MKNDLLYKAYKALEHIHDYNNIDINKILEDEYLDLMVDIQNQLCIKYNINWKNL